MRARWGSDGDAGICLVGEVSHQSVALVDSYAASGDECGAFDTFDRAIADFAEVFADPNELDFKTLAEA